MKRALITGVTGQDGAYLAHLLVDRGYEVYGTHRAQSRLDSSRLRALGVYTRVCVISIEGTGPGELESLVRRIQPDEVYNLAGQSSVAASFDQPIATAEAVAMGPLSLLEAIRKHKPDARFFQASSGEQFGRAPVIPQDEDTPFQPRSPYAVAKLFAHWMTVNYREAYSLFACSGILFSHESPYRGIEFVTRKISEGVARIKLGLATELPLGNLDARRDWGFAGDYVHAMWLMLQRDTPADYVVATGEAHSVREFVELAFQHVGLSWERHVRHEPGLLRPAEAGHLVGNPAKARRELGWAPTIRFRDLVRMMVDADLASNRAMARSAAGAP